MIKRLASYHMMQIWHWLDQKELHCFSITIYGPSEWKQRRQEDSKPSKENVTMEDEYLECKRGQASLKSHQNHRRKRRQRNLTKQKQSAEEAENLQSE